MKLSKHHLIFISICLLFAAAAWAGPKPTGDYLLSEFNDEIESFSADKPEAWFIRFALDGSGGVIFQDLVSSDGAPLESGSFNYAIKPNGELKLLPAEGFLPGIVSPDVQYISIASIESSEPGIIFGVKKPVTPLSMTNKTYIAVQFSDNVNNPGPGQTADDPSVKLMELTLGTNGNGSFQDLFSSDGEIENGVFTYLIDTTPENGNLNVTSELPDPEPDLSFTGIISQDGSVFTFPFTIPQEPGIIVGIEKSNGDMETSKAKGKYLMCQFADEIDNPGPGQTADTPSARIVEITLDGQGGGTIRGVYSSDPMDTQGSSQFTYSLNSNGEFAVVTPGGGPTNGVISKDGNIFILVETSSDYPAISIGIKKSPTANPSSSILLLED